MIEHPEYIEITSSIQARFQLQRGQVLVMLITDGTVYMQLVGEQLETHYQPPRGSSTVYIGNMDRFDELFDGFREKDVKIYFCDGWKIETKKNRILDNIADKFIK